jgi:hypothetical protein
VSFTPPITTAPTFRQDENTDAQLSTADLDAYLILLRDTLNQVILRQPLNSNADGTPLSNTVSTAVQAAVLAVLASATPTTGAALVGTAQPGANVESALALINAAVTSLTSGLGVSADIIRRTGAVAFTADQSMGSHKLTNVANGSANQDAATIAQLNAVTAGVSSTINALRRDGTVAMQANLPFGGFKGSNLGAGTLASDAVRLDQVLSSLALLAADANANAKKITNIANGVAATDAAAFGQIPIVTAWVTEAFTLGSDGTPPTVAAGLAQYKWRRVGEIMQLQIELAAGVGSAAGTGTYRFPIPGGRIGGPTAGAVKGMMTTTAGFNHAVVSADASSSNTFTLAMLSGTTLETLRQAVTPVGNGFIVDVQVDIAIAAWGVSTGAT